jgi:hypothetical protein
LDAGTMRRGTIRDGLDTEQLSRTTDRYAESVSDAVLP